MCLRSGLNLGRGIFLVNVRTSSTAQGGGGSFRNRKPIGEVGRCESRMSRANPLMDRKVVGVVFLEWLQSLQWSPHSQLLDVVVVVVVVVAVVALVIAVVVVVLVVEVVVVVEV